MRQAHDQLTNAVDALRSFADPAIREAMGPRYGIHTDHAIGVAMADLLKLAKHLGTDHELALALWNHGLYEARMLACLVDDAAMVTPEQMDRWCADFDNWGICDTACFKLFDRAPEAWDKVQAWARRDPEFERRAAYALLASLALHRKDEADAPFLDGLALIEQASHDDRNFVRKAVSWALRAIGLRRSPTLQRATLQLAKKLAASGDRSQRWIGKDALRALQKTPSKAST